MSVGDRAAVARATEPSGSDWAIGIQRDRVGSSPTSVLTPST